MQIGIVGLPFSGKSTLYQTITRMHLDPHALGRAEAHHAIVKIPDPRLGKLVEIFHPKNTVHATIEFVDVVGLKKGDAGTTQFTSNFLSSVKTNDALVQVVRLFDNESVPHPDGSIDAHRDMVSLESEFILSDLAIVETRIERIKKQILKTKDENLIREQPLLERCHRLLQDGHPLRDAEFSKEDLQLLKTYQLLSLKPMLIALNLDERQRDAAEELVAGVAKSIKGRNTRALAFFGKIEMEMSELSDEEARLFMAEYGIKHSALDSLIRDAYTLLGLQSFFTVGEDECRAWTIRNGMNAQDAAGVIHSDFFARFIRAEVVHYDDFIARGGSFAKAKEAGVWRLEGKEYIVKDGDLINVRHS